MRVGCAELPVDMEAPWATVVGRLRTVAVLIFVVVVVEAAFSFMNGSGDRDLMLMAATGAAPVEAAGTALDAFKLMGMALMALLRAMLGMAAGALLVLLPVADSIKLMLLRATGMSGDMVAPPSGAGDEARKRGAALLAATAVELVVVVVSTIF